MPSNNAIIGGNISGSVTEDTPAMAINLTTSGALTVNDPDGPAFDSFVAQPGSAGVYGTFTLNTNGMWTYSANNAQNPIQSLAQGEQISETFIAVSADGTQQVVTITIVGTNDAPVAVDDTAAATEGAGVFAGSVATNDTDIDGPAGQLRYQANTPVPGLLFNDDGSYTFNPGHPAYNHLPAGVSQVIVLNYTVTDQNGAGLSDAGVLTLTITGTDDAPTLTPGTGSVTEDGSLSTGGVLGIVDPDDGESSFVPQTNVTGTYGFFNLVPDGTWAYALSNNALNVQSIAAGETRTDSFVATAYDGSTTTVTVTINGTNDAPVVGNITLVRAGPVNAGFELPSDFSGWTVDDNVPGVSVGNESATVDRSGGLISGDNDVAVLTYSGTTNAGATRYGPTITSSGFDATAGATISVTYRVLNNGDTGAGRAFVIDTATGSIVGTIFDVVTDDSGVQTATFALPYSGNFAVQFQDGSYDSSFGGFLGGTLQIGGISIAGNGIGEDFAFTYTDGRAQLLASATDVDASDTLTIAPFTTTSANGVTVTLNADGSLTVDPRTATAAQSLQAGETLADSFTFQVSDGNGGLTTATANFTVAGFNDAAVLTSGQIATVQEDTALSASGTLSVVDADHDQSSYVAQTTSGTYGAFTLDAAGGWTYSLFNAQANVQQLGAGASAVDTFTTTSLDGTTSTVTVRIDGTNDAPVVGNVTLNGSNATTFAAGATIDNVNANFSVSPDFTGYTVDNTISSNLAGFSGSAGATINRANLIPGDAAVAVLTISGSGPTSYNDGTRDNNPTTLLVGGAMITSAAFTASANDNVHIVYRLTPTQDVTIGVGVLRNTVTGEITTLFNRTTTQTTSSGVQTVDVLVPSSGTYVLEFRVSTLDETHGGAVGGNLEIGEATVTQSVAVTGISEDTPFTYTDGRAQLIANATDVDTNDIGLLTVSPFSTVSTRGVSIVLNAAGELTIDARNAAQAQALAAGATLTDTFTYQVSDGNGGLTTATATYTIIGVNDVPTLSAGTATVQEDVASFVRSGTLTIVDADTGQSNFAPQTTNSTFGTFTLTAGGSWTYTLNNASNSVQTIAVGDSRTDAFTVISSDGSATSTVTITINGTNDLPVVSGNVVLGNVSEDGTSTYATGRIQLLSTATDIDVGDVLTVAPFTATSARGATVTLAADGTLSINPGNSTQAQALAPGQSLGDSFSYTVSDNHGGTRTATATFTLTGVNDTPTATADVVAATEGGAIVSGTVATGDGDVDNGAVLTYTLNSPVAGLSIASNGAFSFDPANPAYNSFAQGTTTPVVASYTVTDQFGAATTSTLTINVAGQNDTPVAANDTLARNEGQGSIAGSVAANDSDPDLGAVLTYTTTAVVPGFTLNPNGSYTFDASVAAYDSLSLNQIFVQVISYTVTDQFNASTTATLTITLTGTNDAPVIVADANGLATENGATISGSIANDTDVDGGPLAYTVLNPANVPAGFTLFSDGSYTFNPNFAAYDSIAAGAVRAVTLDYRVSDGNGGTALGQIVVNVTGVNDAPDIVGISLGTIADTAANDATGALGVSGSIAANSNDIDTPDTETFALLSASTTAYGTLTLNPNGSYVFNPNAAAINALQSGSVTISYAIRVTDSQGAVDVDTFTLTVSGTNDTPIIGSLPQSANLTETNSASAIFATGAVSATDADTNATLTYTNSEPSVGATGITLTGAESVYFLNGFSINSTTGAWTYSLPTSPEFLGAGDVVTVTNYIQVSDGQGGFTNQNVVITINGTNDAPVILPASMGAPYAATIAETNAALSLTGQVNFSDVDRGDVVTATYASAADASVSATGITLTPAQISAISAGFVLNPNGSYSYNLASPDYLAAGDVVTATFVVHINDDQGGTVAQPITITITGTNDLPTLANGTLGTIADTSASDDFTAVTGTIAGADVDAFDAGQSLTYSLQGVPSTAYGVLTLNATGSYSFEPNDAAINALPAGPVAVNYTVRVTDPAGGFADATFTLTINGANDDPVAASPLVFGATDDNAGTLTLNLLSGATDVDSADLDFSGLSVSVSSTAPYLNVAAVTAALNAAAFNAEAGTFTLDTSLFNALDLTHTATITFTYNVVDTPDGGSTPRTATIVINGALEVITATPLDDTINGGTFGDLIDGLAGDDAIDGKDGNDLILGNTGDDTLTGGTGNDDIRGGVGNDRLFGGSDNDLLNGGAGNDSVDGGLGVDTVVLTGVRNDYVITQTGPNSYQVVNSASGETDLVSNVEFFQFDNQTVTEANILNRNPVATGFTASAPETAYNGSFAGPVTLGTVTATDADTPTGDVVSFSIVGGNAGGRFAINAATGVITQVAGFDFETAPSYTLTVRASDLRGGFGDATVTIGVTDVNETITQVTAPATASVAENSANGTLVLAAAATEYDAGQTVTYSLSGGGGRFAINAATGAVTVANSTLLNFEAGGNSQVLTITATSSDGSFTSTTSTVSVTDVNEAPTAVNDSGAATEGGVVVTGNVAANDSDPDAGQTATLTYALNGTVAGLTINPNGSYSFDPANAAYDHLAAGATQIVNATYTVTDTGGLSSTAVLSITVTGTNDAPVAVADTAAAVEGGSVVSGSIATNDSDVDDGATRTFALNSPVAGLIVNANGSYTFDANNVAYNHLAQGATQTVTANYTVTDNNGATATSTLTITVTGTNDAPFAVVDTAAVLEGGAAISGSVTANDGDPDDGAVLTYALNGAAPAGLTFNANGSYSFDPTNTAYDHLAAGVPQIVTASYTVTDQFGQTAASTLTITVTGTNDAPVAVADVGAATEGGATLNGSVATNDSDVDDGATRTYALNTVAPAGLTFNPNGSYSFDPSNIAYNHLAQGATQVVTVNYTATDNLGATASASLTITVTGTNDAPVANAATATATEGGAVVTGQLVAADPDDGAVFTGALSAPVAGLTLNPDGSYSFDPANAAYDHLAAGATQVIVASYIVTDEFGATATSTLTITVTGTNDAPVATVASVAVNEGAALVTGQLVATDVDDGATRTFAANGTLPAGLTLNANGSYSFDPANAAYDHLAAGVTQSLSIPYTVTDNNGATATSTLTIVVTGTNDAIGPITVVPDTLPDLLELAANGTAVGSVIATDVDDGSTVTYSFDDNAGGRFAIDAATGAVTVANGILLDYEQAGTNPADPTERGYSVTVRATSSDGTFSTFTGFVSIGDVNPETVVGTAANETVVGGAGNDSFTLNGGNDTVTGGGGNDTVFFNVTTDGADTVNLGTGNDVVVVSSATPGQVRLTFTSSEVGNGNASDSNTLANQDGGLAVRLQAEDGADGLTGAVTRVDDEGTVFVAGAGVTFDVRDLPTGTQRGNAFEVVVLGTNGNDVQTAVQNTRSYYFNGGAGDDTISGGSANDFLVGGSGNDLLEGRGGSNSYIGGTGTDTVSFALATGSVTASLTTNTGSNGFGGTDTYNTIENFTGGGFDDQLTGDGNANVLDGGAGNDTLRGGLGADSLIGGAGIDTIAYDDNFGAVFINLSTGSGSGNAAQGDTYSGIENVIGSIFGDYVIGDNGVNRIDGNSGNDTLLGGLGADVLIGGAGVDTASYEDNQGAVFVNLSTGLGFGNAAQGDTLSGIENLTGTVFADYFIGDNGANVLDGVGGNDTLLGGLGSDTLIGGAGSDTASYEDNQGSVFVNLTTGTGSANAAQGDTYSGIENVTGTSFADVLQGDSGANVLDGSGGNDILIGGLGADTLIGGAGIDTASYVDNQGAVTVNLATGTGTGNAAAGDTYSSIENLVGTQFGDTLTGDSGANVINGSGGSDTLTGGLGADTFVFDAALDNGIDRITDFTRADDTIALSRSVFSTLGLGSLAPGAFVIGTAATTVDQHIIYNSATGALFYDADGSGAGAAVQFATIGTGLDITAANFAVIG